MPGEPLASPRIAGNADETRAGPLPLVLPPLHGILLVRTQLEALMPYEIVAVPILRRWARVVSSVRPSATPVSVRSHFISTHSAILPSSLTVQATFR